MRLITFVRMIIDLNQCFWVIHIQFRMEQRSVTEAVPSVIYCLAQTGVSGRERTVTSKRSTSLLLEYQLFPSVTIVYRNGIYSTRLHRSAVFVPVLTVDRAFRLVIVHHSKVIAIRQRMLQIRRQIDATNYIYLERNHKVVPSVSNSAIRIQSQLEVCITIDIQFLITVHLSGSCSGGRIA